MKKCPKCGAMSFCVTAHVTQDWVVDENGNFLRSNNDCVEVTHFPDDDDIWDCNNCGFSAAGKVFNLPVHTDMQGKTEFQSLTEDELSRVPDVMALCKKAIDLDILHLLSATTIALWHDEPDAGWYEGDLLESIIHTVKEPIAVQMLQEAVAKQEAQSAVGEANIEPAGDYLTTLNDAIALIKEAATCGVLCMPSESTVVLYHDEPNAGWYEDHLMEAAVSLAHEPESLQMLRDRIAEVQKQKDHK